MIDDRLIRMIARERTGTRADLFDDAAQEARIAVWRVSQQQPDASDAYLAACARNAALLVTLGRRQTGAPAHQGKRDVFDTAEQMPEQFDAPSTAAPVDAWIAGDDVRDAVRSLVGTQRISADTMRRIVHLKMWLDMTDAEVGAELGWTAHSVGECWRNRIMPQLREQLLA